MKVAFAFILAFYFCFLVLSQSDLWLLQEQEYFFISYVTTSEKDTRGQHKAANLRLGGWRAGEASLVSAALGNRLFCPTKIPRLVFGITHGSVVARFTI